MFFKILTVAAVVGGGFMFGPQILSGANNSCHAVEQKMLAKNGHELEDWQLGLATAFSNIGSGHFAREAALENNPNVPPAVSCAYAYWTN